MIPKLVIEVRGGIVQHVTANMDLLFVIKDWDNFETDPDRSELYALSPDTIKPELELNELNFEE